jgi:hypothetical protein
MSENKKKNKKENNEETPFMLPPLEFSSIVLPFFTQSMILLGQTEEEEEKKDDKNLDLAKRMIELLELLKEKTEGNLKTEEEQFLSASLHQLKLAFMEKAEIIKL